MNIKIQRIIFAILTIVTFIAIFMFSSQNGEESGSLSREVARIILDILQISKSLEINEIEILIENIQFIIRKLAHFTIYAIVGINLTGFINTYEKINIKKKIIFILAVGIGYAISDEFHQMFSGGRTPSIRDIGIDSAGVIFGMMTFYIIKTIKNKLVLKV